MKLVENQSVILGAPGCGKTTYLLDQVNGLLEAGVDPRKIAYVSFTKKAVEEAATRAVAKFGISRKDLAYFRTVHSLCFQEIGASRKDVMGKAHYQELAGMMGISLTGATDDDGTGMPVGGTVGDQMLFLDNLARARDEQLIDAYARLDTPDFTWYQLLQFSQALRRYKADSGLVDFTDMLRQYVDSGQPVPVEYAIIDEAQDLSRLQWEVLRHAFKEAKKVIIAGDDDQAIYKWSGADVSTFLGLGGTRIVLAKSWRLPVAVHAFSQKLVHRIKNRIHKDFSSREDEGAVNYYTSFSHVDVDHESTWLFLARNTYQLSGICEHLQAEGLVYSSVRRASSIKKTPYQAIVYWERLRQGKPQQGKNVKLVYDQLQVGRGKVRGSTELVDALEDEVYYSEADLRASYGLLASGPWHEALTGIPLEEREYYLMVLRRGGVKALGQEPKIHVGTIHSVKGGEADNVVLLTDMAKKSFDDYRKDPDDETRVFYVGATRARHNLHVIFPTTNMSFDGMV